LEEEQSDLMCFVYSHRHADVPRSLPGAIVSAFADLAIEGRPNILSQENINWEIIYQTAELARKPETPEIRYELGSRDFLETHDFRMPAADIIRQRRSATDFNSDRSIPKDHFLAMLDKTICRNDCAPFDVQLMAPVVNLLLFVHNVTALDPGLYFFFRNDEDLDAIKGGFHSDFLWEQVLEGLSLYLLKRGNFRQGAMEVSCHQEIAGYSAFSVGMIAKFFEIINKDPYRYRHLFWETGMIGQVLYLEAEAHGARGTGIGCFFDDAVHDILGLKDNTWQSLYHFTVGIPLADPRLTTHGAYHHLQRS
jgi:nitroreductase